MPALRRRSWSGRFRSMRRSPLALRRSLPCVLALLLAGCASSGTQPAPHPRRVPTDYTGPYTTWWSDERVREEGTYKEGRRDGHVKGFHPDGSLAFEGEFRDGAPLGQLVQNAPGGTRAIAQQEPVVAPQSAPPAETPAMKLSVTPSAAPAAAPAPATEPVDKPIAPPEDKEPAPQPAPPSGTTPATTPPATTAAARGPEPGAARAAAPAAPPRPARGEHGD